MRVLCALALLAGCRDVPALPDARVRDDAAIDAPLDKAGTCATLFGSSLTAAFGRVDGTVRAVVPPGYPCPMPNGTHLVIQVTIADEVYRMVTNVLSDSGDPRVFLYELDAPLVGPAWAEGWHPGVPLDYTSMLHVTSDLFVPHDMTTTVDLVTDRIDLDTKISVFATSSGGTNASGAHLIHRNLTNADGAIVIGPDTATPHWILFRFDEQTF
ncbi:MAG: hypothetical protein ABI175_18565 [Polyangiales bacterium]